jgi:hypothetical protein
VAVEKGDPTATAIAQKESKPKGHIVLK